MRNLIFAVALALALVCAADAGADVVTEAPGKVETLSQPFSPHWVWVTDLVLERSALIDLDSGRFLGMVNGGYGAVSPLFPRNKPEMYLPASYYARRTRGARTDLLEFYDIPTLSPTAEVTLPSKRAIDAVSQGHQALSDDDRFAAVFNWTPRTSLSIVDVEKREFTSEIDIPGCSLAYAAGPRRFFGLCADGSAVVVRIDDQGKELSKERTPVFFDPRKDPITEKGVRFGNQWIFVSFDGWVYPIDVSGEQIKFGEKWSLLTDVQRKESWRIGGLQHLAVHEPSKRLYSLVHQGGPDTHKEAGEQIWVYDLTTHELLQRIELRNPGLTIYGFPIEIGKDWPAPFNRLGSWLLDSFAPPAVTHIEVTRDEKPLLITASQFSGALGIYDGLNGEWIKRVEPTGWTTDLLIAPWGGK